MRFGLNVGTSAAPGRDPVREARSAEALGFDFVSATDHLHGRSPTYETWTMLAWMAAGTSRIGVATRVLGLPYRSPAVLAKMAETFDRLSGGRLILGLGAGASDEEFLGFGLGSRSPREKIDALAEALEVIRGVWTRPGFTFTGRFYRTDRAELTPKPGRRIPIWLGTFGNRALEVTGRLADGWIPSLGHATPDRLPAMRDRVLAAARDAGRDPGSITCALNLRIRLQDQPEDRPVDDPDVVSGPPAAVAERLLTFAGMGFDTLNLIVGGDDPSEQTRRIADEVIPAVRSTVGR
jgi:alkanesulfonate monooxygenase SsuD/methylene tetrahydromethanopterin reductase-like flavin-dependent oxidoreductase (luciferase family)